MKNFCRVLFSSSCIHQTHRHSVKETQSSTTCRSVQIFLHLSPRVCIRAYFCPLEIQKSKRARKESARILCGDGARLGNKQMLDPPLYRTNTYLTRRKKILPFLFDLPKRNSPKRHYRDTNKQARRNNNLVDS